MKTFKSILEFQKAFDTDEKCRLYLEEQRWGGTPACPHCGSINVCRFSNGYIFKCREKQCRKKFSVTVGTVYQDRKLPLSKVFLAVYVLTVHSKGISALQLSNLLDISLKSAWLLNHKVRAMLKNGEKGLLGGIVEVDETYVGGKFKNKRLSIRTKMKATSNSHDHKTAVMGLVQRDGKVIAKVVENTRRETVLPIVVANIKLGTVLHTDSSWMYTPLGKRYKHEIVNHEQNEYVRGNVHTNTIEGYWSLLKRQIVGIHHSVSPKHLQRYCDEASFRYNHKKDTQDVRFAEALKNVDGSLQYKELVGE